MITIVLTGDQRADLNFRTRSLSEFFNTVKQTPSTSTLGRRPRQNVDLPRGIRAHKHSPLGIDSNTNGPEALVRAASDVLVRHDVDECRRAGGRLYGLPVGEVDDAELVPNCWLTIP